MIQICLHDLLIHGIVCLRLEEGSRRDVAGSYGPGRSTGAAGSLQEVLRHHGEEWRFTHNNGYNKNVKKY